MDIDKAKGRIIWWLKNEYIEFDESDCQVELMEKVNSKYKVKMIVNHSGSEWVEATLAEDGYFDKYQLFRRNEDGTPVGLIYCPRQVSQKEELLYSGYYNWETRTWSRNSYDA
ncbi:hypothetical protein [Iningainema tapete]|uniref:Uncharacterized protein n=1 Tax=Iningainema tapete BLCC-T55 TaxID=2748662 RepID=A0A8J6XLB4_9CYAN|nr:hypothetical protein [Iningainema tapete]MBD2772537.1 hypothetical protein [Iningainema tapete BLCC-T55]